ncbi:MAG TPA: LysR family transcriptional regulator [Paracoccus sp. (in: a-proteobacteria)]|uniref:LysR family transcriptional regulator n=1 Tax=Paracoccus sp. TaxID=267 RepID=UPI002C12D53B|nr:LysR family transcriptional regulator [Paracoccus sp. (in: a-proteobacteria)]HWL59022.1 LysR family transcriptional regulator [Paracoccus sp. (in: a-proteobacteria)]
MKLRQLRFFVKVVETGNITRAADQLNVAQTAIGVQMRNLEEDLRVKLLERHSRGVRPTLAGTQLYERAVQILRQIEETQREIRAFASEKSPIRFGATPSVLKMIGADLIVVAREVMPEVELHVIEELSFLLVDALNRGDLDFALVYDIQETPGLRRIPLLQEDLLHISGPGFGEKYGFGEEITLKNALSGDLALVSERDVIWQMVYDAAAHLSMEVNTSYRVQSMQGIKTLIQHGIAQSIMPYGIVADQIRAGELEGRRLIRPPLSLTLFLAYSEQRHRPEDVEQMQVFVERIIGLLAHRIGPYAHLVI